MSKYLDEIGGEVRTGMIPRHWLSARRNLPLIDSLVLPEYLGQKKMILLWLPLMDVMNWSRVGIVSTCIPYPAGVLPRAVWQSLLLISLRFGSQVLSFRVLTWAKPAEIRTVPREMSTSPLPLPSSPWGRKNRGLPYRVFPNPTQNILWAQQACLQLPFICDKSRLQVPGEERRIHIDFHSSVSSLPASQLPVPLIISDLLLDADTLAGAQICHTNCPRHLEFSSPSLRAVLIKGALPLPRQAW